MHQKKVKPAEQKYWKVFWLLILLSSSALLALLTGAAA